MYHNLYLFVELDLLRFYVGLRPVLFVDPLKVLSNGARGGPKLVSIDPFW